jgi:hypothetical protein
VLLSAGYQDLTEGMTSLMTAPKLLDKVRTVARLKHFSLKTELSLCSVDKKIHSLPSQETPKRNGRA